METLPQYYFPWKDLKLYIVMEHFKNILLHKSGAAIMQHTINQSV